MKTLIEKRGAVTIVTINRPECRNAVDHETSRQLIAAFCAGYDLKTVSAGHNLNQPDGDGPMGPTRLLLSKPVIAAVEGHAVAGGLELALWCDLRVASQTAVFGVFCRRWGVPLIDGGTVRLPRLIGHSRALDMILTGRPVGADEALSFGLANRVVPGGGALEAALELADQIAQFPQVCLRTDRMTSYRQWGEDIADALRMEGIAGQEPLKAEATAGASRFAAGLGRGGDFGRI